MPSSTSRTKRETPPPLEYLLKYRERHLRAAEDLALSRITEFGTDYHRIRNVDDINALNARHNKIRVAVVNVLRADLAFRTRESEQNRLRLAKASRALFRAQQGTPEWAGVELQEYVHQARMTSNPRELEVIDHYLEFSKEGLAARAAQRFAAYYRAEKRKPAQREAANRTNEKRRADREAMVAGARWRCLSLLTEGFSVTEALDAVVEDTGWSRSYARQAIGGVRALEKQAKRS